MAKLIAVGLILALACCQALLTEGVPDETALVNQWMMQYEDVFAEIRPQVPKLTSNEIIERMEFMHSNIDQVRDNERIGEHMINAVDLWYGAIMDKNASHCNLDYFSNLYHKLDIVIGMQETPTNNEDRLYGLFFGNIGNFCRQVLADTMSSSLGEQTTNDLKRIKLAHESFVAGEITSKELAKRVFGQLNLQKSSTKEEITDMWSRGPCNRLQHVIAMPDNRAIYNLIREDIFKGQSRLNPVQEIIDLCFGMGLVCDQLDLMVAELANDYTSGVKNQFSRLFGKHS